MPSNLKNRLQLIRKARTEIKSERKSENKGIDTDAVKATQLNAGLFGADWTAAGYQVARRYAKLPLPFGIPAVFPDSFAVIVRDFVKYGSVPLPCDLVFFDLETTGLSGGAGTLAFLASFGRFEKTNIINITQYLLLDYPGEGDFIELCRKELSAPGISGSGAVIVSYNGKTFDSQIFKNRCLMNATVPPEYFHADLLHPSRRLWKNVLENCSQGTIETEIIGLDRTGDTPGALAPDIWFSFLKTGETGELTGICDHNIRDISGLASICLLLANIAIDPLKVLDTHKYDLESLALLWRDAILKPNKFSSSGKKFSAKIDTTGRISTINTINTIGQKTTEILLEAAVERSLPKAVFVYGMDLLKTENADRGRTLLLKLAGGAIPDVTSKLRLAAFRSLAIDAEWKLRNIPAAVSYSESALALCETDDISILKTEIENRRERLTKKITVN